MPPASSSPSADECFQKAAAELGYSFDGELKIGGKYVPLVRDGSTLYVSGQVPLIGSTIVVTGRVGAEVLLAEAERAAKVCAMRALALLQRELGSLDNVRQILRVTVYAQSAAEFTEQSKVADAASELFHAVLGEAGKHTRTSVGAFRLPNNATVELDLIASAKA
jgi:enamine deaminase RidA (YjgF/YER057c/UK114 family)